MSDQHLSLAQMAERTYAGQTWLSWCRAYLRALQNDDALMVRHTSLMAGLWEREMYRELWRRERGQ